MRDGDVGFNPRRSTLMPFIILLGVGMVVLAGAMPCLAAETDTARRELLKGNYEKAIELASEALADSPQDEAWHGVLVEGLMAVGRYPDAYAALTNALTQVRRSVTLRWLAREAYALSGHPEMGEAAVAEIPRLVSQRPWSYREPADLIAVGRALLAANADPKEVLDRVYGMVRKVAPEYRDVYLASGELALEKGDFAVAANQFDAGLKRFPEDPDLLYGRARAFAESDREEMGKSIEAALKANPRHVPSLLLLVDHRIDAEDYEGALKTLEEIRKINPAHPDSWAYAAVIAHLRNDREAENQARETALKHWSTNPRVPHLIGRKLSQKYRFAEGAELQRMALEFDPEYLPARAQLASDLLRLGDEASGWELIQEVHQRDAYDVAAYNLVTLHDTMQAFRTLTNEHFIVRMSAQEAEIYGQRVLDLLERARTTLGEKYGFVPEPPTTVEIFSNPKDFEVRTFGLPDNPGYLGVCFGRVITANSPASQRANPVNWEAVLWHEYCHVITLQLTANKMPRWLSEGISVYEERLANPAWGEQLNPRYRRMILEGELVPVGKLSAAFLTPKSPLHLQFAYYESSLVVEHLIEQYGLPKLRAILADLREGTFINEAIERHTVPMEELEEGFARFARAKAEALGPGLNWDEPASRTRRPRIGDRAPAIPQGESSGSASNYWTMLERAARLIEARSWAEARGPLEELIRHYPNQTGADSAHAMLARVHRELGDVKAERAALERWAAVDAEATDAYLRLMDLAAEAGDWEEVMRQADRYLAVNPLVAAPYRYLARASLELGRRPEAVAGYQTLLRLDPPNPAEVHFQLARLLDDSQPGEARRHLLQSLEEAPRNREALKLLLERQQGRPSSGDKVPPESSTGESPRTREPTEPVPPEQ